MALNVGKKRANLKQMCVRAPCEKYEAVFGEPAPTCGPRRRVLTISPARLRSHGLVEGLIGHQPLEPGALAFQLPSAARRRWP